MLVFQKISNLGREAGAPLPKPLLLSGAWLSQFLKWEERKQETINKDERERGAENACIYGGTAAFTGT